MAGYRAIFLLLGLLGNSLGGHCSEAQTCEEDDVLSHVQLLKTHGASQRLFCERSEVCIGKEDGPVQSWPDGCTPNDSCKCKSQGLFCKEAKEKEQEEQKSLVMTRRPRRPIRASAEVIGDDKEAKEAYSCKCRSHW